MVSRTYVKNGFISGLMLWIIVMMAILMWVTQVIIQNSYQRELLEKQRLINELTRIRK